MKNSNLVKFPYPEHIMNMVKKESPKTYTDVYVPKDKINQLNALLIEIAKELKRKEKPTNSFFHFYYDKIANFLDMGHQSGGGLVYNELANFGTEFAKLFVKESLIRVF
jgi:hypothetical protein